MGKVDWAEAQELYVTGSSVSYSMIAKKYGVAKSTIVRHGVKQDWPRLRAIYEKNRVDELMRRTDQERVDIEERELRILRAIQALIATELNGYIKKQAKGIKLTNKDLRAINNISKLHSKNMMIERAIIGLPAKPVRITNQEFINELLNEGSPADHLRKVREADLTLDALIKRKKLLDELRNRG